MSDPKIRKEGAEDERLSTADLAEARREDEPRVHIGQGMEVKPSDERRKEEERKREVAVANAPRVAQAAGTAAAAGAAAVMAPSPTTVGNSGTAAKADEENSGPLFSGEETANLRSRWDAIQVGFVDEPRRAVQEADSLVAAAMKRLAEQFAQERSNLEHQWDRGGDVSTEDLRIALRRYRSFFARLLSV
ncbi:MAG TPA: hypothetical protein VLC94_08250 [Candidatus Acidoferrum sp.]|nr:hypothetical protein [Candidatus Acidoferrum sp.]